MEKARLVLSSFSYPATALCLCFLSLGCWAVTESLRHPSAQQIKEAFYLTSVIITLPSKEHMSSAFPKELSMYEVPNPHLQIEVLQIPFTQCKNSANVTANLTHSTVTAGEQFSRPASSTARSTPNKWGPCSWQSWDRSQGSINLSQGFHGG